MPILNNSDIASFTSSPAVFSLPIERPQKSIFSKPLQKCSIANKKNELGKMPLSPPVSPETKNINLRDARIFMNFPKFSQVVPSALENSSESVAKNFRIPSPPHTSEYRLALEFKSQLRKAYGANHRKWAQRELAQLKEDIRLRSGDCCKKESLVKKSISKEQLKTKKPSICQSVTVGNNMSTPRVNKSRIRKNTQRGERTEGSKRVLREDKDFLSITDYSPPLSSLPNIVNCLKVEWKGTGINLSSDPLAHLLHPEEIQLASNLRLDCATYLTSKRRIFVSRLEAYKAGKEFRKTDAQQACRIDVNKASKLWQAFDKVGWLDTRWASNIV
ncbi:SWIRM domain-containing protein FUN19 [Erysiphe necator]|nr:SWIRM domain-containing protein FUN19 [Erysiphe necator]